MSRSSTFVVGDYKAEYTTYSLARIFHREMVLMNDAMLLSEAQRLRRGEIRFIARIFAMAAAATVGLGIAAHLIEPHKPLKPDPAAKSTAAALLKHSK